MTTHVFIVDLFTFKYHLEYLFAGTGAKDYIIDFNNSANTSLQPQREHLLVSMIADASRVRKDDIVLFYLQQNTSQKIYEGKFYGIFKAKSDWSFLDNYDSNQYLKNQLTKSLTFRTLIEPDKVYTEGVTEWEALDQIKHIKSPNQMLWSLIYRKLKGNRGNTMITIYESERLCQLIRNKNCRQELDCRDKLLSFECDKQRIIIKDENRKQYEGRKEQLNVLPRLIAKYNCGKSFEPHLQAYISKVMGKGINQSLDDIIVGNSTVEWIGNEVSCGVGMQRIDFMVSAVASNNQRIIIPIELKAVAANVNNTTQLQRYIDWIEQYYLPNRQSDVQPVLITKKKSVESDEQIVESFNEFNKHNKELCHKLKYVEYEITNDDLVFCEVKY